MIKIDIVKRVAEQLSLKDKEALAVIDTIIDACKETIKEYGRMEIRNFGVFQVKVRKPRIGRNPRNKLEYPIQPRKVVTFKLGKELKDFSVEQSGPSKRIDAASNPGSSTPVSAPAPATIQQASFLPAESDE